MNYVVSQYPLTRDILRRLSRALGAELEALVVSTISANGYWDIVRSIHRLRCDSLYIPALDRSGGSLLAPLQVLAMLIGAKHRYIVGPDFAVRAFGPLEALAGGLRMALTFLHGAATIAGDWVRLGRLLRAPRTPIRGNPAPQVFYLKTNLWVGVQAGGSVAHTSGIIGGLAARGYAVDFASVEEPRALPAHASIRFHPIAPRATYVVPREFNHFLHNRRFFDEALPVIAGRAGFIYQRHSLGNYAGVALSRRCGLPLVLEYNGSERWLANNWGTPLVLERLAMRAEDACLRHAHLIVTVSEELKAELVRRGVEPERVVAYPNGVDTAVFDSARFSAADIEGLRARYGIAPADLVVTFVGTFGPWHGAEVFAECARRITGADSGYLAARRIRFLFVGDGVRRPGVEALIADPRVGPHVTITGLIEPEEAPIHLAASDILVSPHVRNIDGSPFFGSPTKLFEYLAAGRPVVGSDLGQIGEVLGACPRIGDLAGAPVPAAGAACGIRVAPEDPAELAAAIHFLVEHPEWRRAAGRNARTEAVGRYTWTHHVGAVLDGLQRARSAAAAHPPSLRVLFNGLHAKTGGGLTYLRNMLPHLAAAPDVELHLCIARDQRDDFAGAIPGLAVHPVDVAPGLWPVQLAEQFEVPKLARRIGADVVFSPANYGPLLVRRSVIMLRNALSVAFVERRPAKLAYWAMVYLGTLASMLRATRVIAVSEYARRAASGGLIGLLADRLTVVPHGVSPNFSPPGQGARRERFLLVVSDLYVQKNLKRLIGAFARLKQAHPDVALKIAGRQVDSEYAAQLKQLVRDEGLEGRVEFLGNLPSAELVELYRRCAVFVFPSTTETFGNPLVEAMACGAPIACSESAAMPEVVGDAAAYFDPRDVAAMAETIDTLLKDEVRCAALSRKALARAKRYSWERTAERTVAVLRLAVDHA